MGDSPVDSPVMSLHPFNDFLKCINISFFLHLIKKIITSE